MSMSIGEKIKVMMKRRSMTMTELAAVIGQSRQNLTNKMKRDNFTEEETRAIAEALGCSVSITFTMKDTGETL